MGMELEAYLSRPNAISLTKLAAEIGISKGRLSQLNKPGAEWPPELALRAEVTGGELSASALCSVIARARAA